MVFNGDPKTGLGFAWYTDKMTSTVIEVVEASQVKEGVFPETGALVFTGTEEEIETFINATDRETNKHFKFISHKVIVDQLKPGTAYKFRVGNGEDGAWSKMGSFTTDTSHNQDFTFIAGSDSQSSQKSGFKPWGDTFRKAIEYINDPKFLINNGDLVDHGDLEEQWHWMFGAAENELLNTPIVPVLGGHEIKDYDGDLTTDNRNFYNHFNLPKQVVEGTHEGSVYSFEYGDALFLVINSQFEGELTANGKDIERSDPEFWGQVNWMRNTVAKSDKKWKFVLFHKSVYAAGDNSGRWENNRIQFYKKHLIPVIDELGIDLVFGAHDHMYMRSFQMLGDKALKDFAIDEAGNLIDPKGTVYLMSNAMSDQFYTKHEGYDDYFAALNTQPFKKMFTEVSVTDQMLQFTAFTAAVEDEGKENTVGRGLQAYDQYSIKRTDVKPNKAEGVKVEMNGNHAIISMRMPSDSAEPIRGFRIYEENDEVAVHWSVYIPVAEGKTQYNYTVENIDASKKYDFVVKAVGRRMNSDPVAVTRLKGAVHCE